MPRAELVQTIDALLDEMQDAILARARNLREAHTRRIDSRQEFYDFFTPHNAAKPEIHGGFVMAHWGGDTAAEETLKNDLSVTIRCIPLDSPEEPGTCPFTGKPSPRRVLFAKAY